MHDRLLVRLREARPNRYKGESQIPATTQMAEINTVVLVVPERDIRDAGEKLALHIESAHVADLSKPGTEPAQRPAQDPRFKGVKNHAKF